MLSSMQMTPEEFLTYAEQHEDRRFDFIDGEMVEVIPKPRMAYIKAVIAAELGTYVKTHPIGIAYLGVLHVLNGEKFIPDVCINIATDAVYFTTPPLITVEIRPDTQSREAQRRKARAYLKHGTTMSILVFPGEGIEVYRAGHDVLVLSSEDIFDGGDVLPGLKVPVKELI